MISPTLASASLERKLEQWRWDGSDHATISLSLKLRTATDSLWSKIIRQPLPPETGQNWNPDDVSRWQDWQRKVLLPWMQQAEATPRTDQWTRIQRYLIAEQRCVDRLRPDRAPGYLEGDTRHGPYARRNRARRKKGKGVNPATERWMEKRKGRTWAKQLAPKMGIQALCAPPDPEEHPEGTTRRWMRGRELEEHIAKGLKHFGSRIATNVSTSELIADRGEPQFTQEGPRSKKALTDTPTEKEVWDRLKKGSKFGGSGWGMPKRPILESIQEVKTWFYEAVCEAWEEPACIRRKMTRAKLLLSPKQGRDQSTLKGWRPISECSHLYRTLMGVWTERVQGLAEASAWLPDNQYGFRRHRSTRGAARQLVATVNNMERRGLKVSLRKIDLAKAFPSVNRELMLDLLRSLGIPSKLTDILERVYHEPEDVVMVSGMFGGPEGRARYKMDHGIRQGCPASPLLLALLTFAPAKELSQQYALVSYADDHVLAEATSGNEGFKRRSIPTRDEFLDARVESLRRSRPSNPNPTPAEYKLWQQELGTLHNTRRWLQQQGMSRRELRMGTNRGYASYPATHQESKIMLPETRFPTCNQYASMAMAADAAFNRCGFQLSTEKEEQDWTRESETTFNFLGAPIFSGRRRVQEEVSAQVQRGAAMIEYRGLRGYTRQRYARDKIYAKTHYMLTMRGIGGHERDLHSAKEIRELDKEIMAAARGNEWPQGTSNRFLRDKTVGLGIPSLLLQLPRDTWRTLWQLNRGRQGVKLRSQYTADHTALLGKPLEEAEYARDNDLECGSEVRRFYEQMAEAKATTPRDTPAGWEPPWPYGGDMTGMDAFQHIPMMGVAPLFQREVGRDAPGISESLRALEVTQEDLNRAKVVAWTDGSAKEGRTGCGVIVATRKGEEAIWRGSFPGRRKATAYAAETDAHVAAQRCMQEMCRIEGVTPQDCLIVSDCAGVVQEANMKLPAQLEPTVRTRWIKAHVGHTGNEMADEAAAMGAAMAPLPWYPTTLGEIVIHGQQVTSPKQLRNDEVLSDEYDTAVMKKIGQRCGWTAKRLMAGLGRHMLPLHGNPVSHWHWRRMLQEGPGGRVWRDRAVRFWSRSMGWDTIECESHAGALVMGRIPKEFTKDWKQQQAEESEPDETTHWLRRLVDEGSRWMMQVMAEVEDRAQPGSEQRERERRGQPQGVRESDAASDSPAPTIRRKGQKHYTEPERRSLVRRCRSSVERGGSIARFAREVGVHPTTMAGWIRTDRTATSGGSKRMRPAEHTGTQGRRLVKRVSQRGGRHGRGSTSASRSRESQSETSEEGSSDSSTELSASTSGTTDGETSSDEESEEETRDEEASRVADSSASSGASAAGATWSGRCQRPGTGRVTARSPGHRGEGGVPGTGKRARSEDGLTSPAQRRRNPSPPIVGVEWLRESASEESDEDTGMSE